MISPADTAVVATTPVAEAGVAVTAATAPTLATTPSLNAVASLVFLYGALLGWLGMATACYLQYVRRPPAPNQLNLAIFAVGMTLTLLATEVYALTTSPMLQLGVRAVGYLLLSVVEVSLVAAAIGYEPVQDFKNWAFKPPRFTRYDATDSESPCCSDQ